jgi:hypothetical protein
VISWSGGDGNLNLNAIFNHFFPQENRKKGLTRVESIVPAVAAN